jgi:hypothetical protein
MKCNMAGHRLGREMGDVAALNSTVYSTSCTSGVINHGRHWKFNGCVTSHLCYTPKIDIGEKVLWCKWQRR